MVNSVPLLVRIATIVFVILVATFLLAPLVVVVAASFSAGQHVVFPPQGFSLQWYEKVFASSDYLNAGLLSLVLALLVTVSATTIGGAAAIALHRRSLPGSDVLGAFFLSPLVLPTIIYAIGMLMLWSALVGPVAIEVLWIAHTVVALPFVIRTTLAVLAEADPFLEEAARTMGAGRLQRLFLVVIPQCFPGLAAGAFFAFNVSFDEAVLTLFLRKPGLTTLPVQIYGQLEFSPDPSVAAVSAIMIALSIALMLIIDRLLGIKKFAGA